MKSKINNNQYAECINKINFIQMCIDKVWGNFIICEFQDGMKYFEKIIINLDEVIGYIDNINNKYKLNISFNDILEILQRVENSIIIQDYVYSADLLRYEVKEILESWKKIILNL